MLIPTLLYSQNTVGVINNTLNSYNGLTLITKNLDTYLINNCGEVVHQWTSNYPPGNSVYLLDDGSLLRACKIENTNITFGGTGGRIERHDWDGNLLWEFDYSTPTSIQHHDIYPMPNGNVLMLAVTTLTNSEAIQAGRDPNNLTDGELYNEQILELQPTGLNTANVVWEWNIKDHLIQDLDNTKDNYGIVGENPQLLDVNFLGSSAGKNNWLHFNSIQYNENLDQIVISSRLLSEIYVIDHSTTTIESASHSGGIYGKGGDILYRWGNPEAYRQGTVNDRKLYGQHYAHYIPDGLPNAGKIIVFNNGFGRSPSFSEVMIFTPPTTSLGNYEYLLNTAYGPENPDYLYKDPVEETDFFSRFLSGAQQLPNGNILVCSGANGHIFEIDSNQEKVWKYILPIGTSGFMSQGDDPSNSGNTIFRATRYSLDYPAFTGRDLTPGPPIELNSHLNEECSVLSVDEYLYSSILVYPNPVENILKIDSNSNISKIELYNLLGNKLRSVTNVNTIDLSSLSTGVYIAQISFGNKTITKRVIKK